MEEEIWKDIPGYEGIYRISNLGNIKSSYRGGKILKQMIGTGGYMMVTLCKDSIQYTKKVHQLMAITFLGHTPCGHDLVPDHKDGVRSNNKLHNIQIVTGRENTSTCFRVNESTYSSRYVGVSWDKKNKKWVSHIRFNKKVYNLGRFKTEIEASNAYQNALSKL